MLLFTFLTFRIELGPDDAPVMLRGRLRPWVVSDANALAVKQVNDPYATEVEGWIRQGKAPQEIVEQAEKKYPLAQRLAQAGEGPIALPGRYAARDWLPIQALWLQEYNPTSHQLEPISNFTVYSSEAFGKIQSSSLNELQGLLIQSYGEIAGKTYKIARGKSLAYPTRGQLLAERLYLTMPIVPALAICYLIALIAACCGRGFWLLTATFVLHTAALGVRCYILGRPPVTNMYETILYVPWVCTGAGLFLYWFFREKILLVTSAACAIILLAIMQLTGIDASLENVQAVLDSQYWLIIHVLMVVGSYGLFCLAGVLGHIYLVADIWKNETFLQKTSQVTLQALYGGVTLLITGTVLGGVWAAQSWGRFWDWDPKESWAFISACVYLLLIHAQKFGLIANYGLAIGSIIGLHFVAFTWYGVNYILGTGLHSYGFGQGGEEYFYLFVGVDLLFVLIMSIVHLRRHSQTLLG